MRLLTYQTADGPAAAIQVDETLVPADAVDAPASTVRGLLEALDGEGLRELAARAETAEERVPLAEATLCAPIPDAQAWVSTTAITPRRRARRYRPRRCGSPSSPIRTAEWLDSEYTASAKA
jgi:hypothetical protein